MTPIFPLFGYQYKFLVDPARLKGWLKSRQIGGSTVATLDVALDMMKSQCEWNLMSRTGRQAESLLKKLARHVRASSRYAVQALGHSPIVGDSGITSTRVTLANGSVATAMPCDADTTVGDDANWLLDEFALFPNSVEIYAVIKPSIRWGRRIIAISTPRGKAGSKFYELWKDFETRGPDSGWSFHRTTIMDAVAAGCPLYDHMRNPIRFEDWRRQEIRELGDELFAREYLCSFSDKAISLLSMALIQSCVSPLARVAATNEQLSKLEKPLFAGVDVGRRKDLTAIWGISQTGDMYTTEFVDTLRDCPFQVQFDRIQGILSTRRVHRLLIDQTGIGMQLAESLANKWHGIVEPVTFTAPLKDEMAARMVKVMQGGRFLIPDREEIVEDFNAVERTFTAAGNARIGAPRSTSGHADRFWAAALAIQAAETYEPYEVVISVGGGNGKEGSKTA